MTRNVDTIYPLTPLQRGMLHHSRLDPASGIYVEQFSCVLHGPLDLERFRGAWEAVVHRHDTLKTLFIRLHEENPLQVVRHTVGLPFEVIDWRDHAADEQADRFDRLLASDRARGFDFSVAPLMRVTLIDLGHERHRFLWTYHHAILDGWSMPLLLGEVFQRYSRPDAPLPAIARDYRDYVAWLRTRNGDSSLDYWRDLLRGYRRPAGFAPSVCPSPANGATSGADTRRTLSVRADTMPAGWMEAAGRACRVARVTLNTLCQGAWAMLLARYGGCDDVVGGIVVSGRAAEVDGIERMAGLFINTLPWRATLDGELDTADWLRRLQADTQRLEQHAHSALADVLKCSEVPRQQSLFDTLYVFENYPGRDAFDRLAASCGWRIDDPRAVEETSYALALIVLPTDTLTFQLTYDTARFDAAFIERMASQYRGLLEILADATPRKVRDLMLDARPSTGTGGAPDASAHASMGDATLSAHIAAHAARTPDRIAFARLDGRELPGGAHGVTYGTMADRVQRAVHQWRRFGYRPGERVLIACDDPVSGLVLLLSGLTYGVDCAMTDPNLPSAAFDALVDGSWSPEPLRSCVTTAQHTPLTGVMCYVFDEQDPMYGQIDGALDDRSDPVQGACSLLRRDVDGDWHVVRYTHAQLVEAARAFGATLPAGASRDVALGDGPLSHTALWTVLGALSAGLSLHQIASAGDPAFLRRAASPDAHWHGIVLSPEATRHIVRAASMLSAGALRTDWVMADARSLTRADAARLAELAPGAKRFRQLCWPAWSLPHAVSSADGFDRVESGVVSANESVFVADTHLNPAGGDALGTLVVSGHSVPDLMLRNGKPDRDSLTVTRNGTWLRTTLDAWHTEHGCHTWLPDRSACSDETTADWLDFEADVARQAGVDEVALVERIAESGQWDHALFHQDATADAADIVRRLAGLRGVPALSAGAVVALAALPRSAKGRIDRVRLLSGDVEVRRHGRHAAPRDLVETAIHDIWCVLLKQPRIGIHDNYFDLGGDSLQATVMLYQIGERLQHPIDMETLLAAPTIAGLAASIANGDVRRDTPAVDLPGEARLDPAIGTRQPYAWRPYRTVLLTGATGFLGVHLLHTLLATTDARVMCVVRADDPAAGVRRIEAAMQSHGLWDAQHRDRIVAVPGDLGEPNLGLSAAAFDALAREIDAIYHNGALVNFVYPYATLKQVNVLATQDIVRLASLHRVTPIHYVSTVGTLNRYSDALPETLAVPFHEHLTSGYEQSKWVAEQLLAQAHARGVPVTVYRPARIVGHAVSGRMNLDDLFCRLIKGIILFGKAPRDVGFDNILPVDVVSRIIVRASLDPTAAGQGVHVINPRWNSLDALVDFIEDEGFAIERVSYDAWLAALAEHVRQDPAHPLSMLIPVLKKLNPVADPTVGRILPIDVTQLKRLAGDVLASSLRPANDWLRTFFDYFYEDGFLQQPDEKLVTA
ncbi:MULTISPECIES: thioester reductase domain-containing protein [Burkholderia]|uniref:thioester reductase domain-containing protein n=1 Tax=Burkholderia TaxID=32008 RepID=UPI001AF6FB65|nr:thioester reductase domain-containing protein [Burkholderia sp. MS389]CAG2380372.1 Non-ribosomal peptide synthase [Burkholderia cenocepacia]QRR17755.1 NAD-dependent epimerase/dehydratase family protein [Burkholderia sp. MS389]CAG2380543.1 Non-ribosomal peptide synthase [Burkholderia cenocepacia]CAG2380655.1 Non-ribosomal peptide synthase [Burkholderia cenocepacia]CAG2380755.1 Non-ribosomal peptide synthase [Burkholderia cenocepacia]